MPKPSGLYWVWFSPLSLFLPIPAGPYPWMLRWSFPSFAFLGAILNQCSKGKREKQGLEISKTFCIDIYSCSFLNLKHPCGSISLTFTFSPNGGRMREECNIRVAPSTVPNTAFLCREKDVPRVNSEPSAWDFGVNSIEHSGQRYALVFRWWKPGGWQSHGVRSILKTPGLRARFLYPDREDYLFVGRDIAPYEH